MTRQWGEGQLANGDEFEIILITFFFYLGDMGKNYTGALGDFAPENAKNSPQKKKRAPRKQCKSLFNVADLVNGMWKVALRN